MILSLSEEQRELQRMVRRFMEESSPSSEVRRLMETKSGYDELVWKQMADELGLQSVAIPEERGGQGLGFAEVAIIAREMGRSLVCAPYFSTVVLAGAAIEHAGREEWREQLEGAIAAGDTLALAAEPGPSQPCLRVEADGPLYRIHGTQPQVIDGAAATRLIAAAHCGEGVGLFLVDGGDRRLQRRTLATFDRTRRIARLDFDGALGTPIGDPGHDGPALARALDQSTAALCAEMLGGLERVLTMGVDYARERRQFGRAIGSFQAVKHMAADMQIASDCALSLVDEAVESAAIASPQLALDASVAKSFLADSFVECARTNIQIHGGVGFTWEYDTHLHLRRARSSAALLGDARWHRERIAQLLALSDDT